MIYRTKKLTHRTEIGDGDWLAGHALHKVPEHVLALRRHKLAEINDNSSHFTSE